MKYERDTPKNKSALFPNFKGCCWLSNRALKTKNKVLTIFKIDKIKRNKKSVSKLNI